MPGLAICSNKCNIKHFLRTGALRDLARPDRSLLQEIFHHNLLHNISQRLTNLIQQFLSSEMWIWIVWWGQPEINYKTLSRQSLQSLQCNAALETICKVCTIKRWPTLHPSIHHQAFPDECDRHNNEGGPPNMFCMLRVRTCLTSISYLIFRPY